MRPLRGRTKPPIVRSSVVFPAPLAPRTVVMVDAAARIDTPCSTRTPPYPATMSSVASVAPLLMARQPFSGYFRLLSLGRPGLRRLPGLGRPGVRSAEIGGGDR